MLREQLFDVRIGCIELSTERPDGLTAAVAGAIWLTDDIQTNGREVVLLVDLLTRLVRGVQVDDDELYEQAGNGWHAVINAKEVTLEGLYYKDRPPFVLSHEDMLAVLGQYWDCCRLVGGRPRLREGVRRFTNIHGRAPEIPFVLEQPRIRKRKR